MNENIIVFNNCVVCNNNEFTGLYNNTLLKCTQCGFVTANLQISEEKLRSLYGTGYFEGDEYVNYLEDKEVIQKNFASRLRKIFEIVGRSNIKKAVEIGCAYGFFGELIQNEGITYKGYDIAAEAVNYARNVLKLNAEAVNYLSTENKGVTDVFMWDVIEHLSEPGKFLEKISRELGVDGRVYITTGDIGALLPRWQKDKWRMIHPPTHLQYFSRHTLGKLLHRYGFRVIHHSYPPVYRSVRQIFYSLFMLKKNYGRVTGMVYKSIPASLYVPINTWDIIFVVAEKQS